ncbi:MAG: tRNA pseudouridine(55) synthase TruB [Deltaproteobacteria bacterium]|nr:MAG: tRNA pseudouridine(55) synthase TruB [Deltaproteobacteria bacterium]
MHGVAIIDKPAGMTSAEVVARVKRIAGVRRCGHTGTLDPMATGVLPVCLGEATKLAGYLTAEDKAYDGEMVLGVETDTLDREGRVVRTADASGMTRAALERAMAQWVGEIDQIPPMYSAVKRDGRRLHELARAGEVVDRPPRRVRVDSFALRGFDPPRASFSVVCSKGTYVRSLVADVGAALGCGAHLAALRRTRAGRFGLDRAVPLAGLDAAALRAHLIDPAEAVDRLRAVPVPADRVRHVRHGRPPGEVVREIGEGERIRLLTPEGALLALVEGSAAGPRYLRVFTYGLTAR